ARRAGGASESRVGTASADVADAPALTSAIEELAAGLGPVDVLVTSAGEARPGHFANLPDDVFRAQMEVGYYGTLHAARAVVPSMIERRRGHLVFVSSTVALVGVYGYSAYAPVKYAGRALAETLRPALQPRGIGAARPPP